LDKAQSAHELNYCAQKPLLSMVFTRVLCVFTLVCFIIETQPLS